MPTLDDIWAWIYDPLTETTDYRKSNPDKAWADVRAYLLERLGIRDSSDQPFTDDLFRQLDEMRDDDRRVLLEDKDKLTAFGYEIAQRYAETPKVAPTTQQTTQQKDPAQYDENAWQAFLVQNGPRWNGTEAAWTQFETWFRYEADQKGFGYPTDGLFRYLASQSVGDRIATFRQYGVTITAPAPQPVQPTPQPTPAPQPVQPQVEEQRVAEFTDTDLASLLADQPDLADIPPERRRAIVAEVLGELNH